MLVSPAVPLLVSPAMPLLVAPAVPLLVAPAVSAPAPPPLLAVSELPPQAAMLAIPLINNTQPFLLNFIGFSTFALRISSLGFSPMGSMPFQPQGVSTQCGAEQAAPMASR
jgi:hypothetical protein